MIDSQAVLYSEGGDNENHTPAYVVAPLIKYIPRGSIIWTPFDTEKSEFVKVLGGAGFEVVYSHIDYGQDFFTCQPPLRFDIIISNPPFTNKRKIFERALSFGKPIALLMTNVWLNDTAPFQVFEDYKLELMFFNKRIKYNDAEGKPKLYLNKKTGKWHDKITFSSSYYCHGLLPERIVTEKLNVTT
jgi:hypothetical protein